MTTPQRIGLSVRTVFDGFGGLDNVATGDIAMPATGSRQVVLRAHREVAPYRQVNPSCAGTITLSDASGWVRSGSSLTATVTPSTGAVFTGWAGTATVAGRHLSATVSVGVNPPELVANFNSLAEPLTVTKVTPNAAGDEFAAGGTFVVEGTGFTPTTRVWLGGVNFAPIYVSSNQLRIFATRSQFANFGRRAVYAYNTLAPSCTVFSEPVSVTMMAPGQLVALPLTEYYYAALDYYFLTGRAGDKLALDAAAGWARTGNEIRLHSTPNVDTLPLERHFFAYIARGGARGSHFFTAQPDDQALLTALNPTNSPLSSKPLLEGVEGYAVPKNVAGACPAGTAPIYRAFKGPPRYADDGNHRFSASLTQHQDMVNRLGWTDEGVVFCGIQ